MMKESGHHGSALPAQLQRHPEVGFPSRTTWASRQEPTGIVFISVVLLRLLAPSRRLIMLEETTSRLATFASAGLAALLCAGV